jgi:type IV pilus assembly protein PilC
MPFADWAIAHARVSSKIHKKILMDDKMTFFQQLSTLVCSGTPLLQALKQASTQTQSKRLNALISDLANRVASGSSLYAAAANYPAVFEPYWIEIIRTGELSGQMGTVLIELNKQIRESRETRRKVIGSLMYPMILVFVAVTAVTVMLWMVVPTFADMFKDMGAELPLITQLVVDASGWITKFGVYVIIGLVIFVAAVKSYSKTTKGKLYFSGVGLVLPMVGGLLVQMAMYRFASNIALLLKSGVPMLETLSTLSGVYQNSPIYRDALIRARGRVASGRPLAAALEETGLFASLLINMVRTGEESGQLSTVMEQVAPYYKEKMESAITKVTKLLEPIIIMGMGTTIAGLMLAIYMPMFEMAGKVN